MADYHSYIYDRNARRIVGDFEGAYRNCPDTWPNQHDVHLQKYQSVIRLAHRIGPAARVADIGCGYGDFVALLRQERIDAVGYEIAAAAIEKGRERLGLGERLQVADLLKGIPTPDRSFDVVALFGVFWFLLGNVDQALRELQRILKPGGVLVASLSMVPDPIGREVVANYDDFLRHLRSRFDVREALLTYDSSAVAAGKPLAECPTDMVAYCHAR
jgi:SAM-dependent methyltransferase